MTTKPMTIEDVSEFYEGALLSSRLATANMENRARTAEAQIKELEAALDGLWCITKEETGTSCDELGYIHFNLNGQYDGYGACQTCEAKARAWPNGNPVTP